MKFCFFVCLLSGSLLAEDWKPLFSTKKNAEPFKAFLVRDNGVAETDLTKFYQITDSELQILPEWNQEAAPFGFVMTDKSFENYDLKFEYKWGEKRFKPKDNAKKGSGLLYAIHDFENRKHWPSCLELQVQEGDVCDLWILNSYASPIDADGNSITFKKPENFGNRAPKYALHETEGWNSVLLKVRGADSEFYVNGKLVNKVKNAQQRDDKKSPLLKGNIGFQIEGAQVTYRNIFLKEVVTP